MKGERKQHTAAFKAQVALVILSVADGEVRGHLPAVLRDGAAVAAGFGALLPVRQRGTVASVSGLSNTRSGVPGAAAGRVRGVSRGKDEAFFFASQTLRWGEGSARRKRMPGEQAE